MYYGGWGHCNVVRLKEDFTGIRPFRRRGALQGDHPRTLYRGAVPVRTQGKILFHVVRGSLDGPDYSVAYAVSDSPLGPFERIGTIMRQDPAVATGAGHHSVIRIPGTDDYYIVYHRHPLGDGEGAHRQVCIERMTFDAEGRIEPVRLTFEGVEAAICPVICKEARPEAGTAGTRGSPTSSALRVHPCRRLLRQG